MLRIENLHIVDNNTIFYEGNKHYFICQSNDGYTMVIEEIGKDGDIETSYKDFTNVSDAIKYIEQEEINMRYSVDIERSVNSLAYCLNKVNNGVNSIDEWTVTINAGEIDYGIYFNFDIDNKILEISNQSTYNEEMYLDDIIDVINERYDEE